MKPPQIRQPTRTNPSDEAAAVPLAGDVATIRSYIATTTKHGIPLIEALTQLATGKPWLPQTT